MHTLLAGGASLLDDVFLLADELGHAGDLLVEILGGRIGVSGFLAFGQVFVFTVDEFLDFHLELFQLAHLAQLFIELAGVFGQQLRQRLEAVHNVFLILHDVARDALAIDFGGVLELAGLHLFNDGLQARLNQFFLALVERGDQSLGLLGLGLFKGRSEAAEFVFQLAHHVHDALLPNGDRVGPGFGGSL